MIEFLSGEKAVDEWIGENSVIGKSSEKKISREVSSSDIFNNDKGYLNF